MAKNKLQVGCMFPQWFRSPLAELAKYEKEKAKEIEVEKEMKRKAEGLMRVACFMAPPFSHL